VAVFAKFDEPDVSEAFSEGSTAPGTAKLRPESTSWIESIAGLSGVEQNTTGLDFRLRPRLPDLVTDTSALLLRPFRAHLDRKDVARRPVKHCICGGPEHQSQTMPTMCAQDDEISTYLLG